MNRHIAIIIIVLLISGCGDVSERYAVITKDKDFTEWRSTYVGNRVFAGFILNAIPGFHILGLIFDTLYVYSALDDIIFGNGAIIARNLKCPSSVDRKHSFQLKRHENG